MIRPATLSDCARVFRLCCCAKGAQMPYAEFARVFEARVHAEHELCFVAEEGDELLGYVSLDLRPSSSLDVKAAISSLVVSPRWHGMRTFILLQACRIADAMVSALTPTAARCRLSA